MEIINTEINEIINNIKNDILLTRNRVFENANAELISLYYKIGKHIFDNSSYGNHFIEQLSKALRMEFPEATGYSKRNLSRMKKFYQEYKDFSILPPVVAKLPWTHNTILIDKIENVDVRLWYASKTLENGWSKVVLDHQIDLQLYERQADNTRKLANYEDKLPSIQGELALDMIKDPYIFELAEIKEKAIEKDIQDAMTEKIKNVLMELGRGFSFVGSQYKVSTENKDYYIDLLFYHLDIRCYIVVELKNIDFEPSFIGQLQFYVTAVDEMVKKEMDNPTIGLLMCKGKDKLSVEWALKAANVPVGVVSYEVRNYLPTEEEINKMLEM